MHATALRPAAAWEEARHERGWHGRFGHGLRPGKPTGTPGLAPLTPATRFTMRDVPAASPLWASLDKRLATPQIGRGKRKGQLRRPAVGPYREDVAKVSDQIRATIDARHTLDAGRAWYQDEHDYNVRRAAAFGVPLEVSVGVESATSPRTHYAINQRVTTEILDVTRKLGPDLSQDLVKRRQIGGSIMGTYRDDGVIIATGGDIAATLTGAKRRAFFDNMMWPGQTDQVAVDTWMLRSLAALGLTPDQAQVFSAESGGGWDEGIGRMLVADALRDAADAYRAEGIDVGPDGVQGAYWIAAQQAEGMKAPTGRGTFDIHAAATDAPADLESLTDAEYDAELLLEYLAWERETIPGRIDLGPPVSAKSDGSLAADNPAAWAIVLADPRWAALRITPAQGKRETGGSTGPRQRGADTSAAFDEAKHPRGPGGRWVQLGWDDIDRVIEHEFHPAPLDAPRVKHPRSGNMVEAGISRRVTRPKDDGKHHGNESLGPEGPATFDLKDHGDPLQPSYNSLAYMLGKNLGTEPIPHVYRGMSAQEWQQAQARGYIQSDKRGVISDLEGTNAAADPRTAVSYLPPSGESVVAKIAVRPEDKWFTISADEYLRTRQRIPLDRVEHIAHFRNVPAKYGSVLEARTPVPPARVAARIGWRPGDLAADFDEARHPRGPGGRWVHLPGGGRAAPVIPENELLGNALWNSPNGRVDTIRPGEAAAAARIWYSAHALATNQRLRGQAADLPGDPGFAADAAAFRGLIRRSPAFTAPALLYHGTASEVFGPPGTAAGKTFTDHGFVSLSGKYDTAAQYGDAMVLVHVPAGTHALRADQDVWAAAGNPSYYTTDGIREYTLPDDSRFEVLSDKPAEPGIPRTLDVVVSTPGGGTPAAAASAARTPPAGGDNGQRPDLTGLPGGQRFGWSDGDVEFEDAEPAAGDGGETEAAGWREALHPRRGKGEKGGGRFESLEYGHGGRHTGPGTHEHIRSIGALADQIDTDETSGGMGTSETAAALRNVARMTGMRQMDAAKRHMATALEAARREKISPQTVARLRKLAASLDKVPKGTVPEPGFGLRTGARPAPMSLQRPRRKGPGYFPERVQYARAAVPLVQANHPDCPAGRPFGVPGPDGTITCHATRAQAQDLALSVTYPDADMTGAPGGVAVGASQAVDPDVEAAVLGVPRWMVTAALELADAAAAGKPGGAPAERMRQYWSHGEGAAKVRWGTSGDFDRCVMHVSKFMANPQGYCAERHHDALGIWPATHAKLVREGKGVPKAGGGLDGLDVVAFRFRHGWIKIGGDGKRAPLIPEGGEGVPLDPGSARKRYARDARRMAYKPGSAKPVPPLRHPLIPTGLSTDEGGPAGGWEQDYVPPRADGWTPDLPPAAGVKALTSPGRPDGTGTADDPIDVAGDLDKALTLMRDGKHVRLNQPTEIALLLDKIDQVAKRKEVPPPDWDFGLLTVKGTNLFTAQSKGIPRINMPQFSGLAEPGTPAARIAGGDGKFADLTPQFADQLKADGIKVTEARVPAASLRATQTELVGSKVAGFANAVRAGNPKAVATIKEPIYVTRDHYVIDGHHRWAANMMLDSLDGQLGNDTYQNVHMVDMDIGAAIPYSNQFALSMGIAGRGAVTPAAAADLARMRAWAELGGDWDVAAFNARELRDRFGRWMQGGDTGTARTSLFDTARGGLAGRGGLGAHAQNLAARLRSDTSTGDELVTMNAGERRAARLVLRAAGDRDAKALAARIGSGKTRVALSAYERGLLHDALTSALTGHDAPGRHRQNLGLVGYRPQHAAAWNEAAHPRAPAGQVAGRPGEVAARGSGRFRHGWIKIDSAAADDLDRGLNHDAAQRVKHHLDKAAEHAQAGRHDKAEDHLNTALDAATYGGTAPRLKDTIRDAITEQTIKKRRRQKPGVPGAGRHVSRREAEGLAQMFPGGGGKARSRGYTSSPFGRHVSKSEAQGFAQMFAAGEEGTPGGGEAPPPGLPALVTIPGVELLAAGTWHLSTGRQTFTRADLASAAEAAACPAVGPPVIKIGHLDPRFAPAPGQDGEPAIGRVANIRLNDAGTKLTGDLAGMPGWLGAIAASAYPRRSVEGKFRFRCQIGHTHDFVVTALALLGVTPPGVGVLSKLADIAALYGVTPSTTAAAAQAATWRTETDEPLGAVMAVTEEDVRRAYYANAGAPQSWWITELQMEPPQLIVADEGTGKLYRVPYAIEGAAVSFGGADEIVSYSDVAAARGTGPVVVYASAEESRDTGGEEGDYGEGGGEPGGEEGGDVAAASDTPWGNFTKADYTPAQWHAACLIHDHPGGVPDTKDQCKLPVREPGGALNRNGVHAAAGAIGGSRGGVSASAEQKAKAKAALRGLYGTLNEDPPDSIKAAAGDSEAVEAGPGPKHGNYKGRHSHPHFATGDQGDDETHEHVHSHDGDDSHDHAHDTQAAAQQAAASTETGGDLDMGFEFTHDQMAAIRQRLGKADGEPVTADDIAATMATPRAPVVAAAAGGSDTADVQVPQISDGTYLVDGDILRGYQERAVAGDRAVHALHLAERDTILASAVADGKFAQARKPHFETLWDKDPEGTRKLVDKLAPGLIPMASVGSAGEFAGDPDLPGDFEAQRAYLDLYPEDRPGGAPATGVRTGRRG